MKNTVLRHGTNGYTLSSFWRSVLLFIGTSLCQPSFAYDTERANANMAQDLASCMSFYLYFAKESRMEKLDDSTWIYNANWALILAKIYEPNMKKLEAMSDLAAMEQNKVVNDEGIARIVVMRADSCKDILEHPAARGQYWMDKK